MRQFLQNYPYVLKFRFQKKIFMLEKQYKKICVLKKFSDQKSSIKNRIRRKFSNSKKQYQKSGVRENFSSWKRCKYTKSGVRENFSYVEKQYQKSNVGENFSSQENSIKNLMSQKFFSKRYYKFDPELQAPKLTADSGYAR